jgi:hypothetical protein
MEYHMCSESLIQSTGRMAVVYFSFNYVANFETAAVCHSTSAKMLWSLQTSALDSAKDSFQEQCF